MFKLLNLESLSVLTVHVFLFVIEIVFVDGLVCFEFCATVVGHGDCSLLQSLQSIVIIGFSHGHGIFSLTPQRFFTARFLSFNLQINGRVSSFFNVRLE